ncbi:phosphoribosylanthranilate isomerase [Elioraea sp.]|uniref:phosphoribosylanthranilate isomerase n=1 Tax=Elioraea sp. TaxID=2185103 RepID=UPI003F71893C
MRVKICGVNDPDSFRTACDAGADFVGFVFYPASPRAISPGTAARLSALHTGGPARVGLFVDPDDAEIETVLREVRLDMVQLHGDETPERIAAIRARFGVRAMKAVGIATRAEAEAAVARFWTAADMLMFDAKPPPGATLPGGNAVPIDWSVLRGLDVPVPWLLAGGLTPANVAEAIAVSGAPGVDVSSGVERRRGEKGPALIRAFVAAARGA